MNVVYNYGHIYTIYLTYPTEAASYYETLKYLSRKRIFLVNKILSIELNVIFPTI